MSDLSELRKVLDSGAGQQLREYLLKRLMELRNIENVSDKDSPTHQAIEIKAQRKAFNKLKEIYREIMTLSEELKPKDPRDSYSVE